MHTQVSLEVNSFCVRSELHTTCVEVGFKMYCKAIKLKPAAAALLLFCFSQIAVINGQSGKSE